MNLFRGLTNVWKRAENTELIDRGISARTQHGHLIALCIDIHHKIHPSAGSRGLVVKMTKTIVLCFEVCDSGGVCMCCYGKDYGAPFAFFVFFLLPLETWGWVFANPLIRLGNLNSRGCYKVWCLCVLNPTYRLGQSQHTDWPHTNTDTLGTDNSHINIP